MVCSVGVAVNGEIEPDTYKPYIENSATVVYQLATPTTKQVSGQALTLTSGTNVIDITQASLQGLELEVKAR